MQRSMPLKPRWAPQPLQPCRPARSIAARASAEEPLQPWQENKLHQALAAGRRQVKVRVRLCKATPRVWCLRHTHSSAAIFSQVEMLCKELGLPRQTVLQWLKDAPPPPDR